MYLDIREKELIKKAIKDYQFMEYEINNRIIGGITFEELTDFLLKFKGIVITNTEDWDVDMRYLDFQYNAVDMCVSLNKKENKLKVSDVFEIYDDIKEHFVVEDWLTIKEYEKLLNTSKEEVLNNLVADLKYIDCNNVYDKENRYKEKKEEIIRFLKEEW